MPLTQEDKEEVKKIVNETFDARASNLENIVSKTRKFEESPEGRLLVLETKTEDLRVEVHGLGEKVDRLGERIGDVRTEITGEIGGLRSEVKDEIGGLRSEVKGEIGSLRDEIGELRGSINTVKWFVGIMVIIFGALVTGIIVKLF